MITTTRYTYICVSVCVRVCKCAIMMPINSCKLRNRNMSALHDCYFTLISIIWAPLLYRRRCRSSISIRNCTWNRGEQCHIVIESVSWLSDTSKKKNARSCSMSIWWQKEVAGTTTYVATNEKKKKKKRKTRAAIF